MGRITHIKIIPLNIFERDRDSWRTKSEQVQYGGNPLHKKNPADFNLDPPSCARKGKNLCDAVKIFTRTGAKQRAQNILKNAFQKGLFSAQLRNGWPQRVWGLTENGIVLEGMLDDAKLGRYHGYPTEVDGHLLKEIKRRNAQ